MAGQVKDIASRPTPLWNLYEGAAIESEVRTAAGNHSYQPWLGLQLGMQSAA